jgi:hypothetical protein
MKDLQGGGVIGCISAMADPFGGGGHGYDL